MKLFCTFLCAAIVAFQLPPTLAWRHGFAPTAFPKTVLNMNFGADQFANIPKSMFTQENTNGNTPANFNSDGFPHGVLNGNASLSQISMPGNYYGHYSSVSVGNSSINTFNVPPLIVYSGGNSVLSVSPSNTGVSSSGGGGHIIGG